MTRPPLLTTAASLAMLVVAAGRPALAEDSRAFFERRVRPVLVEHCYECHGPDSQESELRVDSLEAIVRGGERGPSVVPGKPDESTLIRAVRHADTLQMPPGRKLPQAVIEDLASWVRDGAAWPTVSLSPASAAGGERSLTEEELKFWAFQPPRRPPLPAVADDAWIRAPVDRFVLSRLEEAGLRPAPEADRRTLIRRATLDLLGLPPTPEEVEAFVGDESPDAWERLIDRLLASPRYGERWGRHWLDVVRYGDSNGLDENLAFANAWRYRDYVVDAFNSDLPYDQFVQEQLAGDLLSTIPDDPAAARRIVATGFWALGAKMLAEDDPVKLEMDIIDEQLDTLGKALFGMTLGCARCHDHKFDPLTMRDYYGLAGILKSSRTMETFSVVARWQERPAASSALVAARDRAQAAADAAQRDAAALVTSVGERLRDAALARTGEYLLAAERRLRRDERLATAQPTADDPARRDAPGRLRIEAEEYARGNVLRDRENYGAGIGVLVNRGETPNFAEYDIVVERGGWHQVDLRYAAAAARPSSLAFDGVVWRNDVAGKVTGSWHPDGQRWHVEGFVELPAGAHRVRLECPGPFPHIDQLALTPVESAADGLWAEPTVDPPLDAELVAQWARQLTETRDATKAVETGGATGPLPLAAWLRLRDGHDWQGWAGAESLLAARLLAEPTPRTLPELAARYQEIVTSPAGAESAGGVGDPTRPWRELAATACTLEPVRVEARLAGEEAEQHTALKARAAELTAAIPLLPEAMAISEGTTQDLRVHLRGSHLTLGDPVPRRLPRILGGDSDSTTMPAAASGRLELADWATQPHHPLTARVIVNRVWQAHFGEGLVRSPDNFGRLGEAPTHPELLDWLAVEFVRQGWSLKWLHRQVLGSATWRQSADHPTNQLADPENRLWGRMNRRRLEAEAVRDSLLAIGGGLDTTMGGSLLPTGNRQYVTSTANVNVAIYDSPRRTLYLPIVRSALFDFLTAFDFGDPSVMSGRRERTTVAPQALFLLNSAIVERQSTSLAAQLLASNDTASDDRARLDHLFRRVYARPPEAGELEDAQAFLADYERRLTGAEPAPRIAAWRALCRALLATNEFLYSD